MASVPGNDPLEMGAPPHLQHQPHQWTTSRAVSRPHPVPRSHVQLPPLVPTSATHTSSVHPAPNLGQIEQEGTWYLMAPPARPSWWTVATWAVYGAGF